MSNDEKYDKIFEEAKNGGRHAGTYRQAMEKSDAKLSKSIRSREQQIVEHQDKINNPEKYILGWNELLEREQKGNLRHWKNEIRNFTEQAEIEKRVREGRKNERNH